MDDKPLDLSKKSATFTRESQYPSSDEQQETEKEEKQRHSNKGIFPQEEVSKSAENRIAKEQENVKFVPIYDRNNADETKLSQDVIPGNSVRTKRKINIGPQINSGAKRCKGVEYPSNPYIKNKTRVLADHDYSDKATRDCTCHEPSSSSGPNCSFHFSVIQGPSIYSNRGEKSFARVHLDRFCSSPADLKHSGMRTRERPTDRKVKDILRISEVSDCSERATSEISPRPSTSATVICNYDSAEVQGHTPINHNRIQTGDTHVRSNIKPFACQLCDKRYNSKCALAKHNRLHTGEGLLKCEYCNRTCVTKGTLKEHTKVHTNERPFVCQVCYKGFPNKNNLKTHMRTHTKEKPYKCRTCNRSFSQKIHLERHKKTHKLNQTE